MTGHKRSWTTASGARLTEGEAARLADEFERDDALPDNADVRFPRKAGRPSLTGDRAISPQVTFRVSPALRAAAEHLAAERGTTVSSLAREALEQFLKRSA